MREILLEKARDFQELNNAARSITLPPAGYPILDMHVAFGADMDIGQADENFSSANIPFAIGYTYQHDFPQADDWTFDPTIFGPPFFPGTGFAGVKYLRSPRDSVGRPAGLTVFGAYNGQTAGDAQSSVQLYRFLTGKPNPAVGDPPCNAGDPAVSHICFLNRSPPGDMRFFQATGPITLRPGQFESVVVAYVFAAPVKTPGCAQGCDLAPGDPTVLGDASRMAAGVNPLDSVTGYLGFTDADGDGRVAQDEFEVVPGSLLGKARVAQTLFDSRFLQTSSAPKPPPFSWSPVRIRWPCSGNLPSRVRRRPFLRAREPADRRGRGAQSAL